MSRDLLRRQSIRSSRGVHGRVCDADCPQPVLAKEACGHSASVRPARVHTLKEEQAGSAGSLLCPGGLELASELKQELSELRPFVELDVPESAAAPLPDRAKFTRARLELAEALLHAAKTCLHVDSLAMERPLAIGTLADATQ